MPKTKSAKTSKPAEQKSDVLTAEQAATQDGLPETFIRKPGQKAKPLSPEGQKRAEAAAAASPPSVEAKQDSMREALRTAKAEQKAVKATARKAKAQAAAEGKLTAMPLEGKAAEKLIKKMRKQKPEPVVTMQVEAVEAKPARKAKGNAKPAGSKGSKVALIGTLLARKQGCTRADVLQATGWPAVSMQQQAKALGVKLKVQKLPGEVSRYYAA